METPKIHEGVFSCGGQKVRGVGRFGDSVGRGGTKMNLDAFLMGEGGGVRSRIRIINLVSCGNSWVTVTKWDFVIED